MKNAENMLSYSNWQFSKNNSERWLSGRRRRSRKPLTGLLVQGFESPSLRHFRLKNVLKVPFSTIETFVSLLFFLFGRLMVPPLPSEAEIFLPAWRLCRFQKSANMSASDNPNPDGRIPATAAPSLRFVRSTKPLYSCMSDAPMLYSGNCLKHAIHKSFHLSVLERSPT